MNKRSAMYGLLAALAWTGMAQAQVHLSALDKTMAGPHAKVMVLGSVHLSQMHDGATAPSLEPLLARLAAFRPEVITVEQIPGEACEQMGRYPDFYPAEGIAPYCDSTAKARKATGLDVPVAVEEVHRVLVAWPAHPTPAQRRHLAALFLAAGDHASALTQWLQLTKTEQHTGDGLDAALVSLLDELATRQDESLVLGARLAARLGLPRVFPVDDHTGDNIDVTDAQGFGNAIRAAWDSAKATVAPRRKHEQELFEHGDLLALYRYINRPDVLQAAIEGDFGAALRDRSPEHFGQLYVAGWETRNLRMVANVRAAFRERPGARVLAIVGSTHKPWFDSLLGQMQGVDIVDVEQMLRP
jgi:hypothetical protein